jgi:membrane-associated phospholipid phosphatase
MQIYKSYFIISAILLISMIFSIYYFYYRSTSRVFSTYFNYSQAQTKSLQSLNSTNEITPDALKKWDSILFDLIKENKLGDAPASRVYAYLYTAQRDMTFLSLNIKHKAMGNIDIISSQTLCLFFQNECSSIITFSTHADSYSNTLANIVLEKIKERIQKDKEITHLYVEKSAGHYWAGVRPYFGQDVGSWMPWFMQNVKEFVAPPPPPYDSPEWHNQLNMTKTALAKVTEKQTKSIVFWSGNPGTVTPPGLWLIDANSYIFSHFLSIDKIVLIRSVLAMGMADSVIAVFNSKYTYWVKRPFMLDPSIYTVMPTPNHPSYPAGHSTISSAAATILEYYFPENRAHWTRKMEEASMGRVWGGIHFTIDAQQGLILGHKVGEKAIQMSPPK